MPVNENSIDQAFQSLKQLEVNPPVNAWESIAAALPPENTNKKPVFWMWLGLAALIGLFLASSFWLFPDNGSAPMAKNQVASTTIIPKKSSQSVTTTSSSKSRSQKTEAILSSGLNETSNQVNTKEDLVQAKTAQVNKPQTPNRKAIIPGLLSSEESNNTIVSKQAQTSILTSAKESNLLTKPIADNTDIPVESVSNSKAQRSTLVVSPKSIDLNLLDIKPIDLKTKLPSLSGPGIACEDFKNSAQWNLALRVFAGPGFLNQDFSPTEAQEQYLEFRESTEEIQINPMGGLRFEANTYGGLLLRAGADYQMYRSRIVSEGAQSTRTIIDSIFMEDTQTWRVETSTETFKTVREVYNRVQTIALTAGVGYRPTFGAISPYIVAEAGYEFLVKQRGTFPLSEDTFIDLESEAGTSYINQNPGLQFGGTVGLDFYISSQFELGISGNYKRLAGLQGTLDPLSYDMSIMSGALNLRYNF